MTRSGGMRKILRDTAQKDEGVFTRAQSNRTRVNGFKMKESRFRSDVGKKFFPVGIIRHWKSFPKEVVDVPSLEVLKARIDGAGNNLVYWKLFVITTGGLELDDL